MPWARIRVFSDPDQGEFRRAQSPSVDTMGVETIHLEAGRPPLA